MRDHSIRSIARLTVGYLDFGTGLDLRFWSGCVAAWPSLAVYEEGSFLLALKNQGIEGVDLLSRGETFKRFEEIKGVTLLLLYFREGENLRVRTVNYLSRKVTTTTVRPDQHSCRGLFGQQNLVAIESHPPIADVFIDNRQIGEAPVWTHLRPGRYQIGCRLPQNTFRPETITVPNDTKILCQRENQQGMDESLGDVSTGDKLGAALVYLVGIAASVAAAILLPIFVF